GQARAEDRRRLLLVRRGLAAAAPHGRRPARLARNGQGLAARPREGHAGGEVPHHVGLADALEPGELADAVPRKLRLGQVVPPCKLERLERPRKRGSDFPLRLDEKPQRLALAIGQPDGPHGKDLLGALAELFYPRWRTESRSATLLLRLDLHRVLGTRLRLVVPYPDRFDAVLPHGLDPDRVAVGVHDVAALRQAPE